MTKFRSVIYSILAGLFVIIFPVISGVIASIFKIQAPYVYYLQGGFMLIPMFVFIIVILIKKIDTSGMGLIDKISYKKLLWFLPSLLIYIPVAVKGFEGKDIISFFGLLFLYLNVGITEELYYRSLNRYLLDKKFELVPSIIISTLVFGLGHTSTFMATNDVLEALLTVINAIIFGFMAVCLLYIANTIYPLMIIHFFFDFETKFTLISGSSLLIAEIIRGTIMTIYGVVLFVYLYKSQNSLLKGERVE